MVATAPILDTELASDRPIFFACVELNLPDIDLRMLFGSSQVTFGGNTFVGHHDVFGTLSGIETAEDGRGDQAPNLQVSFIPESDAAAGSLSSPTMQGSRIRMWVGAIIRDPVTGKPTGMVADPYEQFDGELDQPVMTIDKGLREVTYSCASTFEYFFDNEEAQRLSESFHQSIWPGERGFRHMTGIVRQVIWGPGQKLFSGYSSGGGGASGGGFAQVQR